RFIKPPSHGFSRVLIRSWMPKRFIVWRPPLPSMQRRSLDTLPKRGQVMIDAREFAQKQMELTTEFAKYVVDHPEVDASLPEDSYIYFEVAGEPEFSQFSRQLAERRCSCSKPPCLNASFDLATG